MEKINNFTRFFYSFTNVFFVLGEESTIFFCETTSHPSSLNPTRLATFLHGSAPVVKLQAAPVSFFSKIDSTDE